PPPPIPSSYVTLNCCQKLITVFLISRSSFENRLHCGTEKALLTAVLQKKGSDRFSPLRPPKRPFHAQIVWRLRAWALRLAIAFFDRPKVNRRAMTVRPFCEAPGDANDRSVTDHEPRFL